MFFTNCNNGSFDGQLRSGSCDHMSGVFSSFKDNTCSLMRCSRISFQSNCPQCTDDSFSHFMQAICETALSYVLVDSGYKLVFSLCGDKEQSLGYPIPLPDR